MVSGDFWRAEPVRGRVKVGRGERGVRHPAAYAARLAQWGVGSAAPGGLRRSARPVGRGECGTRRLTPLGSPSGVWGVVSMATFTHRQGQFLAFIHLYCKLHRRRIQAELDMARYFGLTPPAVHGMVVKLHDLGLITRQPGVARSIRVAIPEEKRSPRWKRSRGRHLASGRRRHRSIRRT